MLNNLMRHRCPTTTTRNVLHKQTRIGQRDEPSVMYRAAYTNVRWRDKEAELAQKQADTELRSVLTAEIEARVRCRSYEQRIENAWRNRV